MFEAERRHMKQVDYEILSANGQKLKELQELDKSTQMSGMPFYEVYLSGKVKTQEEKIASNVKNLDRKKPT